MGRKVVLNETSLENIGDAIRYRYGDSVTYIPSEMAEAIRNIPNTSETINVPYTETDNASGGRTITISKQIVT